MSEPSISFTITTLLAAETNLPIAEGMRPTSDPVYLTDGAERHILVQTTASKKGKLATKIDICHSRGEPYNAHSSGNADLHVTQAGLGRLRICFAGVDAGTVATKNVHFPACVEPGLETVVGLKVLGLTASG